MGTALLHPCVCEGSREKAQGSFETTVQEWRDAGGTGKRAGSILGLGAVLGPQVRAVPSSAVLPQCFECPTEHGAAWEPGSPAVHSSGRALEHSSQKQTQSVPAKCPRQPQVGCALWEGHSAWELCTNPIPALLISASHLLTYQNLTSQ